MKKKTKVKIIYKYGTGAIIPKGAVYLCTLKNGRMANNISEGIEDWFYVWHYFLVEVEQEINENS